jgi:hypothetical protein
MRSPVMLAFIRITLGQVVRLGRSPGRGRGLFAVRAVPAGTVVLSESAFLSCSLLDGRCDLCLRPLPDLPTPCRRACSEAFCSPDCENRAWNGPMSLLFLR